MTVLTVNQASCNYENLKNCKKEFMTIILRWRACFDWETIEIHFQTSDILSFFKTDSFWGVYSSNIDRNFFLYFYRIAIELHSPFITKNVINLIIIYVNSFLTNKRSKKNYKLQKLL